MARPRPQVREQWQHTISRQVTGRQPKPGFWTGRGSVYPITRPRSQGREQWQHTISRRATARQPKPGI